MKKKNLCYVQIAKKLFNPKISPHTLSNAIEIRPSVKFAEKLFKEIEKKST